MYTLCSGDVSISCPQTGIEMTGSFKNRGYFQGENNSVECKISTTGAKDYLYKITGRWDRTLSITGTICRTRMS
jgi:hypothetical protein